MRTLAITYSSREQTREALLYALLEEPSGRVVADCEGPHMAWLLLSCLADVRGYLEARHAASLLLRAYPVRGYGKEGRQVCVCGGGGVLAGGVEPAASPCCCMIVCPLHHPHGPCLLSPATDRSRCTGPPPLALPRSPLTWLRPLRPCRCGATAWL